MAAVFVYWPSVAVPVAVQVKPSPGASSVLAGGQLITPIWSSTKEKSVSVTKLVFVKRYVQVTGAPAWM